MVFKLLMYFSAQRPPLGMQQRALKFLIIIIIIIIVQLHVCCHLLAKKYSIHCKQERVLSTNKQMFCIKTLLKQAYNSSIRLSKLTDIHQRYQTSYTAPCNGVVTHGAQFSGLQVFANHSRKNKRKTNVFMIFARHSVFCACFIFTLIPQQMQ